MAKKLKYSCGCQFEISNGKLEYIPTINSIDKNCTKTWDMICEGNTLGCFQLESFLGQKLARECKPRNILELAELISVMRPGCLEATLEDGNTVTAHYIKRKNGQEDVVFFTEELEPILQETYGLLLYQEQAMKIATDIAGFSMVKADTLRKGIGKKDVDLMAALRQEFVEGATKVVGEEKASQIFEWIEKSQRYSFNKSHAVGYAQNCYISAYSKAHFPRLFFAEYANMAKDLSEVGLLINNARDMGLVFNAPLLRRKNIDFEVKNKQINYGLGHIKSVSASALEGLLNTEIPNTWQEFLITKSCLASKTVIENLIKTGALGYHISREKMIFEYNEYRKLNSPMVKYIEENASKYKKMDLINILDDIAKLPSGRGQPCSDSRAVKKLEKIISVLKKPPYSTKDDAAIVGKDEFNLLGAAFSCTELDTCSADIANCTCKEFADGFNGINGQIIMAINVKHVKEIKTKRGTNPGQTMCFVSGYDEEAEVDGMVVFPDIYPEVSHYFFPTNTLLIKGKRGRDNSLIIQKVWQI